MDLDIIIGYWHLMQFWANKKIIVVAHGSSHLIVLYFTTMYTKYTLVITNIGEKCLVSLVGPNKLLLFEL
jgi:hypothetical protein